MKSVFIVVEGQSEQEFVNAVLGPYLCSKGILQVVPIPIRTSKSGKGGFVKYSNLKDDVVRLLHSKNNDRIVTTMVDFFRMPKLNNQDGYITELMSHKEQVAVKEELIDSDINDRRFFSYIQLHEYEALLFSAETGFEEYMPNALGEVRKVMREFPNPEDINTSPAGAPSKRLLAIDAHYDKVVMGGLIAMSVGIERMLDKCPLFRQWVEKIVLMASEE